MKLLQTILQRTRRTAKGMAWRAGYCLLAAALLALPAAAGDHAYLNILITVAGSSPTSNIPITGLVASTAGALPGTINLAWTEPTLPAGKPPLAYDIRISSTGQITNNSDFSAALPLSAFSSVPLPPPGPGNNQALLAVPGLQNLHKSIPENELRRRLVRPAELRNRAH